MIYIYDILLNWFTKKRCIDFFEWQDQDEIEHIKKIPLIRISSSMLKDCYYDQIKVDKEFLDKIKNKTESFYNNGSESIEYATLFSDGKKCLAIEFDEGGYAKYKSTLLLDEEEEVLELVEELILTNISYEKEEGKESLSFLTRKEEENQLYLLKELEKIKKQKEMIDYLYEEYFEEKNARENKYQYLKEAILKNDEVIENGLKNFFLTVSHKKV